jgi:serine/threonine protein kinase
MVKICDFGSSKFIDEKPGSYKNTPYVVSRYYRAPELIFASNKYNEAIDIWAVGCILFELLTRTPLFPGDTEGLQILEQACVIGSPSEDELSRLGELVEEKVISVVRKAASLTGIPFEKLFSKERYGAEAMLDAAELVSMMLRWVPGDRISAAEALNHRFFSDVKINEEAQQERMAMAAAGVSGSYQ